MASNALQSSEQRGQTLDFHNGRWVDEAEVSLALAN